MALPHSISGDALADRIACGAVDRLGLQRPRDLAAAPLIQMSRFPRSRPDWFAHQGVD